MHHNAGKWIEPYQDPGGLTSDHLLVSGFRLSRIAALDDRFPKGEWVESWVEGDPAIHETWFQIFPFAAQINEAQMKTIDLWVIPEARIISKSICWSYLQIHWTLRSTLEKLMRELSETVVSGTRERKLNLPSMAMHMGRGKNFCLGRTSFSTRPSFWTSWRPKAMGETYGAHQSAIWTGASNIWIPDVCFWRPFWWINRRRYSLDWLWMVPACFQWLVARPQCPLQQSTTFVG